MTYPSTAASRPGRAYFGVAETGGYIGKSDSYVRQLIRGGVLPYSRVGQTIFIAKADIDAWLKAQYNQATQGALAASAEKRTGR